MALDSDSKQFSPPSVRGLFDTLCRACGLAYKLHQYNGNQEAAQALVDQVLLVLVKVGVSFALAGDVCKDAKLVSAKIATSLATSAIVVAHEGQWLMLWRCYLDSSIEEAVYYARLHLEASTEDTTAPWWSEAAKGDVVGCPKQLGKLFFTRFSYGLHMSLPNSHVSMIEMRI